jgi:hypothetical protein
MITILSITYEIPWYPDGATAWLFWIGLAVDLGGLIRAERRKILGSGVLSYRPIWALLGLVVHSLLELRATILAEILDYDQFLLHVAVVINQSLAGLAVIVLSVVAIKLAGWRVRQARRTPTAQ